VEEDFYDPIYKGCTAPSTFLGVPLVPFVLGALVVGQVSVITFYFAGLRFAVVPMVIGFVLYLWARRIGTNDEHRLLQVMLKARIRGRMGGARRFWGAVSFSPRPPRKT
jgi:type IV secretory pathway VirB3-like protein